MLMILGIFLTACSNNEKSLSNNENEEIGGEKVSENIETEEKKEQPLKSSQNTVEDEIRIDNLVWHQEPILVVLDTGDGYVYLIKDGNVIDKVEGYAVGVELGINLEKWSYCFNNTRLATIVVRNENAILYAGDGNGFVEVGSDILQIMGSYFYWESVDGSCIAYINEADELWAFWDKEPVLIDSDVQYAAISPDGSTIAYCRTSDGIYIYCDGETRLLADESLSYPYAISADNNFLFCGTNDDKMCIQDLRSQKIIYLSEDVVENVDDNCRFNRDHTEVMFSEKAEPYEYKRIVDVEGKLSYIPDAELPNNVNYMKEVNTVLDIGTYDIDSFYNNYYYCNTKREIFLFNENGDITSINNKCENVYFSQDGNCALVDEGTGFYYLDFCKHEQTKLLDFESDQYEILENAFNKNLFYFTDDIDIFCLKGCIKTTLLTQLKSQALSGFCSAGDKVYGVQSYPIQGVLLGATSNGDVWTIDENVSDCFGYKGMLIYRKRFDDLFKYFISMDGKNVVPVNP